MTPGLCWLLDPLGRTTWMSRPGMTPLPRDLAQWSLALATGETFDATLGIDGADRACRITPLHEGDAPTGWCGVELDTEHARCRGHP